MKVKAVEKKLKFTKDPNDPAFVAMGSLGDRHGVTYSSTSKRGNGTEGF